MSPQRGFEQSARRATTGEFVDSYSEHLKQNRWAVGTVVIGLVAIGLQLSVLAFGLYKIAKPTPALAYSTTVNINPTWDNMAQRIVTYNDNFGGGCDTLEDYTCNPASVTLDIGRSSNPPGSCDGIFDWTVDYFRSAMKFSLSSIPNNATITNVVLAVNVADATTQSVTVFRASTDTPDALGCAGDSALWSTLGSGTNYAFPNWNSTGAKTVDLGTTADSDVQSRLTGSDIIAIGVKTSEDSSNFGTFYSVEAASSNRPQLQVTYTLPPQTPTGFGHTANATTSISWNWTDNATVETQYNVHDASHAPVAGCSSLAANTQTCTETGLSANTQYTRHANVTDADGNTDSSSASAYTSIETPSGVTFGTITNDAITISSTNTPSNLNSGSSGILFRNTSNLEDSGWVTTNSWTQSNLGANSLNGFDIKARNGDGDETGFCLAVSKYTLAANPNVTSPRLTSTWYDTDTFTFNDNNGFGGGGQHYYRYVWDQVSTHAFSGTESTWSDLNLNCPGGTCTNLSDSLNAVATSNSNSWYLHVQSFNGDNVATGSGTNYGPYFYNNVAPTITDNQAGDPTPRNSAGTTYNVDFTKAADGPQLDSAQYAVYSGPGKTGTLIKNWTNIFTTDTDNFTTNWSVDFVNLQEGLNYVSVRTYALDGLSSEDDDVFTVTKDTLGPNLVNVDAIPSATSLVVTWGTNEPATSQVEYGPDASYGSSTTLQSNLVTDHSATISGLTAGTTYHYRVHSRDGAGNLTTSADLTETTLTSGLTSISNVRVIVGETVATVRWNTNEPATSKVRYGTTSTYGSFVSSSAAVTNHELRISSLASGTTYHYQVVSTGSSTVETSDDTFTTASPGSTVNRAIGPTLLDPIIRSGSGTVIFTGVAKGNQTIRILVDNVVKKTVRTSGPSVQTKSFSAVLTLTSGRHVITAQSTDEFGRTSLIRQSIIVRIASVTSNIRLNHTAKYVVQAGDSLWEIAERHLGDGNRYVEIAAANSSAHPSLATSPNVIIPGWNLRLPRGL